MTAILGLVLFVAPARAQTDIEKLIVRAKQGDVASQLMLGDMYRWNVLVMSDGSRVEKDLAEAVRWYTEAAKQQVVLAKAMLGGIYSSDDFAKRDDRIAARWFAEVARSGDPDKDLVKAAQYQLGVLHYQECTGYLISLTCGPHKTSMQQNYQFAAGWFARAAKEGHREAQFELATMYEHGRGVLQDFAEAAKLYRAAAEGGNEEAPVMLGELFVRTENLISAHMWFNIAAADDRSQAAERRDKLAKRMTAAQIAEAQKLAREYRAARKNDGKK